VQLEEALHLLALPAHARDQQVPQLVHGPQLVEDMAPLQGQMGTAFTSGKKPTNH